LLCSATAAGTGGDRIIASSYLAPASLHIKKPGLFARCVAAFFKNVDYLRIRSNSSLMSQSL
jgi:hypothetical protein